MYILLFGFWLLLNGKITLEICLLGAGIVFCMALLESRLFGYRPADEIRLLKANAVVSRCILFKHYKVTPTLVTLRTDIHTEFGRFLLANSITLTPGTITIRVEGNELTVHCLDGAMLDLSENGVFQRWIRRLEA